MRKKLVSAAVAAVVFLVWSSARADDPAGEGDGVMTLARQLSDAVRGQDAATAKELLDTDALYDRLSAGVSAPADFQAAFRQGIKSQAHVIMGSVVKAAAGGSYHLLRIRHVNGEAHILFRVLANAGGLNYHDWVTGKDQQGLLKLQDANIAITGELMSQTMHRAYVQAALAANPGLLDRLKGRDKEMAANLSKLQQLAQDSQNGQYQQVLDGYKALPKSMQEDKNCMILRLAATQKLREQLPQEYDATMADYQRLFPGDPSVDLVCMDALFAAKKFAEARKSLDRLDAYTGGDAYLMVLRGNTYKLEGGDDNLRLARQSYDKALDEEPTLAEAYWSLVTLSLEARQYQETAALLTKVQQKLHMKINDLTKIPAYAGFVKSDAYQKWIAGQAAETPEK